MNIEIVNASIKSTLRINPRWRLPVEIGRAFDQAWRRGERAIRSGRTVEAKKQFTKALAIIRRLQSNELHPEAAVAYGQLAICAQLLGNIAVATDHNARTIAILEQLLDGKADIELIIALMNGALFALERRDLNEMENLLHRANAVGEKMPPSPGLSELFASSAKAIAEEALKADMPMVAAKYRLIELDRLRSVHAERDHPDIVECLCELGKAFFIAGMIHEAINASSEILEYMPNVGKSHFLRAGMILLESRCVLSQVSNSLVLANQMESICLQDLDINSERADAVYSEEADIEFIALSTVMRTYSRCNKPEKASALLPYLLIYIDRDIPARYRGAFLSNIGQVMLLLKKFDESARYYRRAIATFESIKDPPPAIRGFLFQSWQGFGRAHAFAGQLKEAEQSYDAALIFAPAEMRGAHVIDLYLCRLDRAGVLAAQGRHHEAIAAILDIAPLIDAILSEAARFDREYDFVPFLTSCRASAGVLLSTIAQLPSPDEGIVQATVQFCWHIKQCATRIAHRRSLRQTSYKEKEDNPDWTIPEVGSDTFFRVTAQLGGNEVLLEYFYFADCVAAAAYLGPQILPDRFCVAVIRPEQSAKLLFLEGGEKILRAVSNVRRTLLTSDPPASLERALRKLSALILAPLDQWICGSRHLIIAPDGPLSVVPFEILPGPRSSLLITEHCICYIMSGLDLLIKKGVKATATPACILADPDFDALPTSNTPKTDGELPASVSAINQLQPLKWARAEGNAVASALGVEPLLGVNATKHAVLQLQSPEVLHFATHGFAVMDHSEDDYAFTGAASVSNSILGVALSGANLTIAGQVLFGSEEDGLLLRQDLARVNLSGTALVSFSACQTGRGDLVIGEGIWGLGREALLSGADAVLMSLWDVPDFETYRLMTRFYESYAAAVEAREALREAKLELLSLGVGIKCWAGFVLVCHSRPSACRRVTNPN